MASSMRAAAPSRCAARGEGASKPNAPRRQRAAAPRAVAVAGAPGAPPSGDEQPQLYPNPFGEPTPMSAAQETLGGLSGPAMYGVAGLLVAGGAAVGAGAAGAAKAPLPAKVVLAGAGAAAGAAAYKKAEEERKEGAAVAVHNVLASLPHADALQPEYIAAVAEQYGVDLSEDFPEVLKMEYNRFVSSVLPDGDQALRGDEADRIVAFKAALGITDEDAANVHLEVGRRIFRQRLEVSGRDGATEERRAFQKLVFVSTLVFGERKSRFLLPWKRVFDFSEAQVQLACNNNAGALYEARVREAVGATPPTVEALRGLRAYQTKLGLKEDLAAAALTNAVRAKLEAKVETAYESVKRKTRVRDFSTCVEQTKDLLAYNGALAALAGDSSVAAGTGAVTLYGGVYDNDARRGELKEIYQGYLTDGTSDGVYTAELAADLEQLKLCYGMGNAEAEKCEDEVMTKMYRQALRTAVQGGELKAAESKALYLQGLCDRLRFDPAKALAIHTDVYRNKLKSILDEKRAISDEDQDAMLELRVLLCVQEDVVRDAQKELCGTIYAQAVDKALSSGTEAFGKEQANAVRGVQGDLRLPDDIALETLTIKIRAIFNAFIGKARSQKNQKDAAKELRKMVFFNANCVCKLLEPLKPDAIRDVTPPPAKTEGEGEAKEGITEARDLMAPEQKKADADRGVFNKDANEGRSEMQKDTEIAAAADAEKAIEEVKAKLKAKADEKAAAEGKEVVAATGKAEEKPKEAPRMEASKTQTAITMAETLELQDRKDLYQIFLFYCLSGDTKTGPMGVQMTIERDQSEFLRLQQLGDVLGLSPIEVSSIHSGLSEKAFREQAKQVLADGKITPEKQEYIKKLQAQLGVSDEVSGKVVKGITSAGMIKSVEAAIRKGELTIKEVRDLTEADVDVESMISLDQRTGLLRKGVEGALSNGTGVWNSEEFEKEWPTALKIKDERARDVVREVGVEQKKMALVNAVASLRAREVDPLVSNLKNLLAAHACVPDVSSEWRDEDEVQDLYAAFVSKVDDAAQRSTVAEILGLEADKADKLTALVSAEGFALADEEAEIF